MKSLVILIMFMATMNYALSSDQPKSEKAITQSKIEFLLKEIESSNAIFIRNTKKYTSKEASDHLRHKVSMAKKRFWFFDSDITITIDDFVEKIASKSSFTGKDYQMKLTTGKITTTNAWLKEKLKSFK